MNRNVNMTGNFSSGKSSLKPGDTAFNNRKVSGADPYVGSRVMNTNSNFNSRPSANNVDLNMGNSKYKFNENDMNEAKESLKLLKMKMGGGMSNITNTTNMTNTENIGLNKANNNILGGNTFQSNGLSNNTNNTASNSNYRKPFKPTFENENNDRIQIDTTKKVVGGRTMGGGVSQMPQTKKVSNINSNIGKKIPENNKNMITQPKFQIQELEDDRPAFASGGQNNFDVEEEPDDDDGDDVNRIECRSCGRKFKEEAYQKHSKICKKVFVAKRKTFDVKKQRIIDSEHATMLKHKEFEEKKKEKFGKNNTNPNANVNANTNKKNKWKKQSEEFRAILRANINTEPEPVSNSKGGMKNAVGRTGANNKVAGKGFVSTPSVLTEDYQSCTMCNRKYNEQAYSKHLPTCERRTKEAAMKNKNKSGPISSNIINTNTTTNSNGTYGNKPNLNVKFGKK